MPRRGLPEGLTNALQRGARAVAALPAVVFLYNCASDEFVWIAPSFEAFSGHRSASVKQLADLLQQVHPEEREQLAAWFREPAAAPERLGFRLRSAGGDYLWLDQRWRVAEADECVLGLWLRSDELAPAFSATSRRLRDLDAYVSVSRVVFEADTFQAALGAVADVLVRETDFSMAVIEEYDGQRGELTVCGVQGMPGINKGRVVPLAESPVASVAYSGRSRVVQAAPAIGTRFPRWSAANELGSWVAVPLCRGRRVYGVLTLAHAGAVEIAPATVEWIEMIGAYLAAVAERRATEQALRDTQEQLVRTQEVSLVMTVLTGLDGSFWRVPGKFCRLLGYREAELLELRYQDVTHADDLPYALAQMRRLLEGEAASFDMEKRYLRRDGQPVWVYLNVSVVTDRSGQPLYFLSYVRDISEQKRVEETLRLAASVFDNTTEGILVTDKEERIVAVNQSFSDVTGYRREEVIGQTPRLLNSGSHDAEFYERMWESLYRYGRWEGEIWNRRKNGDVYPELLNINVVKNDAGEVVNYVALFRDITELKAVQRHLETLANIDALTGLPNRNLFYDRLRHGIDKAQRSGRQLAVMFVDLDNFKQINDTLGHDAGDTILKEAAQRLEHSVRAVDTVARLGGDEFTVLLEEIPESTVIAETAQRINQMLYLPVSIGEHSVEISGSIGISVYPDDGTDYSTLLKNADTAMYKAKQSGRNNYQFFAAGMNARTLSRVAEERELQLALERKELEVLYQPQFEIKGRRLVGLEATLRWHHPVRGIVPAREFIPVAEATGLIEPLGRWALDTVCRQVRHWADLGLLPERVSVHLSPHQFSHGDVVGLIADALSRSGTAAGQLELELTEQALMARGSSTAEVMAELRRLGIHISVDGFGCGYSSLTRLHEYPIERLKIDRSVVATLGRSGGDRALIKGIVELAHSLTMRVVAEGVESRRQLRLLRALGCDEVQGFYCAAPTPADELLLP